MNKYENEIKVLDTLTLIPEAKAFMISMYESAIIVANEESDFVDKMINSMILSDNFQENGDKLENIEYNFLVEGDFEGAKQASQFRILFFQLYHEVRKIVFERAGIEVSSEKKESVNLAIVNSTIGETNLPGSTK
jgi:hypothetical protein